MRKTISKIIFAVLFISLLSNCKKTSVPENFTEIDSKKELAVLRQQTMANVLVAAKNSEFRQFILNECLKQKHGDYNVYLKDVVSNFKAKPGYEKITSALEELVSKTRAVTKGREPIIFYPKAETIEKRLKANISARTETEGPQEPVGVYEEEVNPDYSSPGYILDNGSSLVFYQNITEDYAWENDVWVIGEEENVSEENSIAAPEDMIVARTQGQSEYGGIIQCTDLNAIEHWTSGKLEFKIFIFNGSGAQISVRAFGKWKRSNFRNQNWKDFGHFVGNWNTSTFGHWMYENWWEEDGGQSNSTTITMPPPSGQTGPTVSTTIPSQNRDDNLGMATIQFTDLITQVYNISYANIKRRN